MNYYKDLHPKLDKSPKQITLGFFMFSLAVLWIIVQLFKGFTINGFDWVFFTIFAANGLFNGIKGFGLSFESLFGKAFVSVNEESITIKVSAFAPVCTANWNDIECIEYKPTRFRLTKYNSPEQRLCMRELDADTVNELRTQVEKLATQKSIPYHTNIRQNKLSS